MLNFPDPPEVLATAAIVGEATRVYFTK